MLLQPVCPERRGPSWVPSRRSRWPSALGAHSAPCAAAFFSDRAEEACSSGESRAIYTNGHPNERSEEKGQTTAEAPRSSLDLFLDAGHVSRGPCRGPGASLRPSSVLFPAPRTAPGSDGGWQISAEPGWLPVPDGTSGTRRPLPDMHEAV